METREAVQRLILVEPKRVYDLHESAINACCPRSRTMRLRTRGGGCGSRGPGGRCSACSRVAATRVRWASGCACAAYPRAGPGARFGVKRVDVSAAPFCEACRATVLRVSYARLVYVCRRRPPWAWRRGRGSRPELAAVSIRIPIIFSDLGAQMWPCGAAAAADITNTKLHGSFADRPRPISREFSFTHFVTDALRRPRPRVIACNRSIL